MTIAAMVLAGYLGIGLGLVAYLSIKERESLGWPALWLAVVWPVVLVAMVIGIPGDDDV